MSYLETVKTLWREDPKFKKTAISLCSAGVAAVGATGFAVTV